jgi:hypothetical protein
MFFSRWLVTELGPWLNVTSGIAGYPWRRFIFWDVLGEVLWVVLYVMLGYIFSDRVQYIAEILGNSRLGNFCPYCRNHPWLETIPIFSTRRFRDGVDQLDFAASPRRNPVGFSHSAVKSASGLRELTMTRVRLMLPASNLCRKRAARRNKQSPGQGASNRGA